MLGGRVSLEAKNASIFHHEGKQDELDVLSKLFQVNPSAIIVISNDNLNHSDADAKTITTVLLLNHLLEERKESSVNRLRIICEILDSSSKDLLDRNVGVEFVLSSEITTRLISQISVDGNLQPVFEELFTPEGNEIYVKKASFYTEGKQNVRWLDVCAQARAAGEIALGVFSNSSGKSHLNPPQDGIIELSADDGVIVCADSDDEYEYTD